MSQAGIISTTSGPVPPAVPTSFVTDVNSPAVPVANVLNVFGNDTTANDDDGIRTDGSSGGDTLTIQLTNRLVGTGSTIGAVTADLVTFSLGATPSCYTFEFVVSGYDSTGNLSTGYWHFSNARTTGVAATVVGTDETFSEDAALGGSDVDTIASGNDIILRVTGVLGVTIQWKVVGYYVQVS